MPKMRSIIHRLQNFWSVTKFVIITKIKDKLDIILNLRFIQKLHVNQMTVMNQVKGTEIQIALQLRIV